MGGTVLVLGVLSVLLCLVSLAVGSHSLTLEEVAGAFVPGRTTVASVIVWQLRMPRTVLAVMVGASLAVAGVVMQGLTAIPWPSRAFSASMPERRCRWSSPCLCWG